MKNKDTNKENCFAFYETANGEKRCRALKEKNGENCNFYRNDLKRVDIERDIKGYAPKLDGYKKWNKEKN